MLLNSPTTAIVWNPKTMKETTEIQPQILIIDDDVTLCAGLRKLLRGRGYKVECIYDGDSGLHRASEGSHDLVILDVMMPKKNGIKLLQELRSVSEIPVIMLTTRGEEIDRIVGLEAGADDYLPKPFSGNELLLRINAILKRTQAIDKTNPKKHVLGPLQVDPTTAKVTLYGKNLQLTSAEIRIIVALIKSTGDVLSREYLTRHALNRELSPYDRSLDTHINNLRKKLGRNSNSESPIGSIRGRGYYIVNNWIK